MSADLEAESGWVQARWIAILDRIDHRDPDVGLRFWGPPLWLEVTMVGPDSDGWPTIGDQATAWDWQSSTPCDRVAALARAGADDDHLLAAVCRYTIENLILNAVHEIGEWFRFDGRRLFPAHTGDGAGPADQGNGAVAVRLQFGREAPRSPEPDAGPPADADTDGALLRRLVEAVPPARFSCLPGTTISYERAGPVAHRCARGAPRTAWRARWSDTTVGAVRTEAGALPALVGRDVHRALVSLEADRICRAFHVDGIRPWTFAAGDSARGADPPDTAAPDAEPLTVSIDVDDSPRRAAPCC